MSEERNPVSREAVEAEYRLWTYSAIANARPEWTPHQIKAAINAALGPPLSAQLAAAREAGRLEGLEEAIRILDAIPRGLEPDWTGTTRDMFPKYLPARVRVPTVDEGAAAIRAKMEGK